MSLAPPPHRPALASGQALRIVVAVLAIAFFFTPLVLLAAGQRGRAFENRKLEAAPTLSDGWNLFNVSTRYLIDRMPLRDQAVHANTWISEHVFHTTPDYGQNGLGGIQSDQALPFSGRPDQDKATLGGGNTSTTATGNGATPTAPPPPTAAQVTAGTDGWFFLAAVMQRACQPAIPFAAATADWEKLLNAIRASGRKAVLVVAPDKSTIYPEYLSPSTPDLACSKPGTAALWQQIESPAARSAGIIGLRQPLLAEKQQDPGRLLYYKTDSHWNNIGALSFTQAVLPAFSPTVRVEPSEIKPGPGYFWKGDLLNLLGQDGGEQAPNVEITRHSSSMVNAPTLLIGDSYSDAPLPQLHDYFSHLSNLNWNNATPKTEIYSIVESQDVILETVEREFDYRAGPNGLLSPKILSYFLKVLAANPLRR